MGAATSGADDDGVSSVTRYEPEEMDVSSTGEEDPEMATNAGTASTGEGRLTSEVSYRQTRSRGKRHAATIPSQASLFQDDEDDADEVATNADTRTTGEKMLTSQVSQDRKSRSGSKRRYAATIPSQASLFEDDKDDADEVATNADTRTTGEKMLTSQVSQDRKSRSGSKRRYAATIPRQASLFEDDEDDAGEAATNAGTTTTTAGERMLASEVSEASQGRETRSGRKRRYVATISSQASLYEEDDAGEASRSESSKSVSIITTSDDDDEEEHHARGSSALVSSQRSRGGNVKKNIQPAEVNIDLAYLKTGELALVWYNGNENFGTFTSKKSKEMHRASLKADLGVLCEMVERIVPELMKSLAASGPRNWKNNIKLSHIGLLVKGLVTIQRIQLQACKKSLLLDYETLKNPVRIAAIDLPTEANAEKRKKKHRGETTINGIGDAGFGAFSMELAAQSYDPTPRAAAGGEYLESTRDGDGGGDNEGKKSKKRSKTKRVKEQDIIRLLEQRGAELWQNAGANTLSGAGIDLPAPAQGDFTDLMDSCQFFDVDLERQERQEGEKGAKETEKDVNEKSPPSMRGKQKNNEPPVPRKRARAEESDVEITGSSFGLNSEIDDDDSSNVQKRRQPRRRRLHFTRIDKTPTISIEAFKQQILKDPKAKEEEQRQLRKRRNECMAKPLSTIQLTGLQLITSSGKQIPSEALRIMIKETIPKPAEVLRRILAETEAQKVKKQKKRHEDDAEMEIVRDRPTPEDEVQGFVEQMPIGNDFGLQDDAYLPNDNVPLDFGEAECMVPRQAESIAASEETQERIANGQGQEKGNVGSPITTGKTFADIIGSRSNRARACRFFGVLLKLQGQRKIQLIQDEAYGEIRIEQLRKK